MKHDFFYRANIAKASSAAASTAAKAATATKKSIVDQQNTKASGSGTGEGKESLWQRMLKLTSQLTQSKLKGETAGAARSMQSSTIDADRNAYEPQSNQVNPALGQNTKNNYYSNIANNNANSFSRELPPSYQQAKDDVDDLMRKPVEYRRLQQYWDMYYKRYYESLGLKKMPDWMTRSPWSNDPERVQGALDSDTTGNGDVPGNSTVYQNWNSYLQNYYQYPGPPNYNETSLDGALNSTIALPNSTSESLIENVIENDLYSKGLTDKTLNRDLYFEDQLIHNEEKKRPRINVTRLVPTTRLRTTVSTTTVATTAGPRTTASTTTGSIKTGSTSTDHKMTTPSLSKTTTLTSYKTTSYPYNSSNYTSAVSESQYFTQNNETMTRTSDAEIEKNYSSTTQEGMSAASSVKEKNATDDSYASYLNSYKQYIDKWQNNTNPEVSKSTSQAEAQAASPYAGSTNESSSRGNSSSKAGKSGKKNPWNAYKVSNFASSQNASVTATNDDGQRQQIQPMTAGEDADDDDDNDDLERLDISTLVRELIKLENIRKRKELLRRKKIQRENSKAVANLLVGDLFKGYFKTKKPISQKGLKKHLLHKTRRLIKTKVNQSPLPKFS